MTTHQIPWAKTTKTISTVSSNILSGAFLRMTVIDPEGGKHEYERPLIDRIGFAIRQGDSASTLRLEWHGSQSIPNHIRETHKRTTTSRES